MKRQSFNYNGAAVYSTTDFDYEYNYFLSEFGEVCEALYLELARDRLIVESFICTMGQVIALPTARYDQRKLAVGTLTKIIFFSEDGNHGKGNQFNYRITRAEAKGTRGYGSAGDQGSHHPDMPETVKG